MALNSEYRWKASINPTNGFFYHTTGYRKYSNKFSMGWMWIIIISSRTIEQYEQVLIRRVILRQMLEFMVSFSIVYIITRLKTEALIISKDVIETGMFSDSTKHSIYDIFHRMCMKCVEELSQAHNVIIFKIFSLSHTTIRYGTIYVNVQSTDCSVMKLQKIYKTWIDVFLYL